ncbi:MAG: sulfotransferase, partial [Cyanobacteria bacterium P01_A01_bin.37]
DPFSPELYCGLSNAYYEYDLLEKAMNLLRKGIELYPEYINLYFAFSRILEKENDLEEAKKYIHLGLDISPGNLELNILLAKLDGRSGKIQEAIDRLEQYVDFKSTYDRETFLLSMIHFELGKLYDHTGCSDLAIMHCSMGNNIQLASQEDAPVRKYRFLNYIYKMSLVLSDGYSKPPFSVVTGSSSTDTHCHDPVFLVGFPRSGTTLLAQILDSHPKIQVLHEKPVLQSVMNEISIDMVYRPDAILALNIEKIHDLRNTYFEEVNKYLSLNQDSVLIDKNPFNLANAGIIHRIFPNAKFIFAMRHPYDACQSCFMQHFGMNDALSSFYTLEDSAILYTKLMTLWEQLRTALKLQVFESRYERLVNNLEESLKPLLSFMDLEWNNSVANYREYAKTQKGKIHTPSYSQIVQPLYKDATYRWKRYKKHLEPVIPLLAPHAQRLGYPTD